MEINKQTLDQFRKDFEEAVKNLETKYSVDVHLGPITYELNSFHATVTVRKEGLTNAEWNWHCAKYGFKPEDLGRTFLYGHKQYKIVGIKDGNKYPIQAMREDGELYSFTPDALKACLETFENQSKVFHI